MNKIRQVFAYEFVRNVRRKGFIAATIGLPLIGLIIMFGVHIYQLVQAETEEPNPLLELDFEGIETAGIVDLSGEFGNIPESLAEIIIPFADEDDAWVALNADEIDVFYVVASDYLETGEVVLYLPNLSVTLLTAAPIEQLFYESVVENLDNTTIQRLRNPMNVLEFNLEEDADEGSAAAVGFEFAIIYIFTILFFIGLIMTNTYLMQSVIEERENKLVEILISAMRPTQLLAGKILALGLLGMIQIVFWIISVGILGYIGSQLSTYSALLSLVSVELRWELVPIMLVYFVLMYMTFAAIFGGIGAISGSASEGQQYIGLLVLPTILPFYVFPLIESQPNGTLAVGLSLFPITSGVTMLMRNIVTTVPMWQLAVSISVMIVTMLCAMWVSGRLFRVQTLLAGSFKLGDVPRLMFGDGAPRKAHDKN